MTQAAGGMRQSSLMAKQAKSAAKVLALLLIILRLCIIRHSPTTLPLLLLHFPLLLGTKFSIARILRADVSLPLYCRFAEQARGGLRRRGHWASGWSRKEL